MGDLCDMNDVDRFMRSAEGQEHLDETVRMLKGKTITGVTFSNETHAVMTTLHLSDGDILEVLQPDHEVEALRETFAEAIQEEYDKDYPERRNGNASRAGFRRNTAPFIVTWVHHPVRKSN